MSSDSTLMLVSVLSLFLLVLVGILYRLWRGALRSTEELKREIENAVKGVAGRPIQAHWGGISESSAQWLNQTFTQLEERRRELEEDRRQLDVVLSGMSEGVLAVDSRQRLSFANPAAQRLFNLELSSDRKLVSELIRSPQIQVAIEATLSGAGAYRAEFTMPGRDPLAVDQSRVVSVQGTPLPGSPPPGAVLVLHDVTEIRRLERMRQDFVANASHELKTPLTAIKVNTETLLDWGLRDDTVNQTLLRQIEEQADRLDMLVRDMLSLARLESGQEQFRHEPLILGPVVEDCVSAHESRARARGLDFETTLDALEDQIAVRAATEAIRQILNNLIDNAIKYTPEGGVIRITSKVVGARVVLEVADTGIGIPREDIPRIFERFYRVDKARSRQLGGTGLGLSIVKHISQGLGGEVSVESHLGAGSTFSVFLPRCDVRTVV